MTMSCGCPTRLICVFKTIAPCQPVRTYSSSSLFPLLSIDVRLRQSTELSGIPLAKSVKMRRAAGHTGVSQNGSNNYNALEEENERLVNELNPKVAALKHLSIEIGTEVRTQNKMLAEMDDDFSKSGGLLERTMGRLQKMSKAGHHCHMFYLLLFCLFVFFVLYLIIKTR